MHNQRCQQSSGLKTIYSIAQKQRDVMSFRIQTTHRQTNGVMEFAYTSSAT